MGEFRLQYHGWKVERRFAAVCERVREGRDSASRTRIDVPGYNFRVFATSCSDASEKIRRNHHTLTAGRANELI